MTETEPPGVLVAAFYHFAPIRDPLDLRGTLVRLAEAAGLRGSLLVAAEGINGTLSGEAEALRGFLAGLQLIEGFSGLDWKESHAETPPFRRLKVRLKREIVTMGQPDVDPRARVGRYVSPQDWNALIDREDVVLIDTRNDFEVAIGSFDGALDPRTESFRDFPAWYRDNAEALGGKTLAMFCTGGIRCEKATSWLVGQGVEQVVHLEGGILKYLEEVPEDESRWHGECFVFDERVSVKHGLEPGRYVTCFACGDPVAPEDLTHPHYERGVSCAGCINEYSDEDRTRFRERQRQADLAAERGDFHFSTRTQGG